VGVLVLNDSLSRRKKARYNSEKLHFIGGGCDTCAALSLYRGKYRVWYNTNGSLALEGMVTDPTLYAREKKIGGVIR